MPKPIARAAHDAPVTPLRLPKKIDTLIVFGGTFDPPTCLHQYAGSVATSLGWDPRKVGVLYVPASRNPLKARASIASDEHRVAMLREGFLLSLNSEKPSPMGVIWTDEIDRARWLSERGVDAPSYMIDTIRRLRTLVGQSITLRLLIGADQAIQFDRWRDHRALARLAEPLVMLRPPHASPAALLDELASRGMRAPQLVAWARRIVPEVAWDTSATRVRELLPLQPLDHDLWDDRIHLSVDAAVAQYIITHRLYAVGSKWKPPRASARTAKARRPKPARE